MEYRNLSDTEIRVSEICLGSWAFGGDAWWGPQEDRDSVETLKEAINLGINFVDTAPVYGRDGRSESIIGAFLNKRNIRNKVILATKVGLVFKNGKINHNLSKKSMLAQMDESRKRLRTDYIDLYQIHWPDPKQSIAKSAELMYSFYQKGIIKSIGVSNYSLEQMEEFIKHSVLHTIQPSYNMFERSIENNIVPFCLKNKISIINYIPLCSGILTGKFFFGQAGIPNDICRKRNIELQPPRFEINKKVMSEMKKIADKYKKTLTQLVLNWTINQKGIISAIVGSRKKNQIADNAGSVGWVMSHEDIVSIEKLLDYRKKEIEKVEKNMSLV